MLNSSQLGRVRKWLSFLQSSKSGSGHVSKMKSGRSGSENEESGRRTRDCGEHALFEDEVHEEGFWPLN